MAETTKDEFDKLSVKRKLARLIRIEAAKEGVYDYEIALQMYKAFRDLRAGRLVRVTKTARPTGEEQSVPVVIVSE